MQKEAKRPTLNCIHKRMFRFQLILILTLAVFLGGAGIAVNMIYERDKRDQNLRNIAEAVAMSPLLAELSPEMTAYLDSLQNALGDIDVISVVDKNGIRQYHSNHALIGTTYDGTTPNFSQRTDAKIKSDYYAVNEYGPSGNQRRAYAAIRSETGEDCGFVMAIMLMENVREEMGQILLVYALITLTVIGLELLISTHFSREIKESLLGYEPDVFTAMFRMRDNILESLEEGIIAANEMGEIQFLNGAAIRMLGENAAGSISEGKQVEELYATINDTVIVDRVPILEDGQSVGSVGILHDRMEYTKLMEDLAGTRYLVDSMRASNHDFTNKLHVILGLIQMEMYDEAVSYIQNITIVGRETISAVMRAIDEPAVAALLIGKISQAAELNVKFTLREGTCYQKAVVSIPTEVLITVIGNLIENAFEAMNNGVYEKTNELLFGIYSKPGALLITVDDTGSGIAASDKERIFDNGYSTKGDGRGTGLYQVKNMLERMGGTIAVESQMGVGTSFTIRLYTQRKEP